MGHVAWPWDLLLNPMNRPDPDPKPIRARITVRIHEGEIVASVSDEAGDVSLHREPSELRERRDTNAPAESPDGETPPAGEEADGA